ncbi:uncharacterized protein LAESUDRAFT_133578 [Laetiporus sulphureus 93-53]|uniref:Uncharacterized protein n=1 Tax=Laetiporus sulphureus 93-53 TaxID=1314785 RepID=A0A165EID6_9APHY|nr:uncharacterized protein LAESUDRAFT_133578 [Laetiporus sulphureus 93-53]KZT07115.1 hypothetical protein LAESUDRAFT_133578 [Laetiporus sulphureus 93-53]
MSISDYLQIAPSAARCPATCGRTAPASPCPRRVSRWSAARYGRCGRDPWARAFVRYVCV